MSQTSISVNPNQKQEETMRAYYQLHAKIYDLTRWSFLFGRKSIIKRLAEAKPDPQHILEIGCGTGYNLLSLAKAFPQAKLTGLDVSANMIAKAQKQIKAYSDRVDLVEKAYTKGDESFAGKVDMILFSYSLTMINPQWEELLEQAAADLAPDGVIGVTDFYDSRFQWFKDHMGNNHVRMDGHLTPKLKSLFETQFESIKSGYGIFWEYFVYVGKKV